jgi:hypothetical protein
MDEVERDWQKTHRSKKSGVSILSHLRLVRDEMQLRSELERSALVNSFLTGPTGLLSVNGNLDVVTDRIVAALAPENRELGRIILEALYQAEGSKKSLFLSYVLAQKSDTGRLSEALVLKSILDAYGVPGVKLAQYLAFTDEFKVFKSTLDTYQDAAMPISYYELLLLIQERLGEKWSSEKFRIVEILGTGSVNIAVEYVDLRTGEPGVLNISRKDITTKTSEDFHRMERLLQALSQHPQHGPKFDFVVGLMGIIKNSVSLEFDKKHAFEVQKEVQDLYNREVNGWKVRTVDAYSQEGMTIMMQKAPGKDEPAAATVAGDARLVLAALAEYSGARVDHDGWIAELRAADHAGAAHPDLVAGDVLATDLRVHQRDARRVAGDLVGTRPDPAQGSVAGNRRDDTGDVAADAVADQRGTRVVADAHVGPEDVVVADLTRERGVDDQPVARDVVVGDDPGRRRADDPAPDLDRFRRFAGNGKDDDRPVAGAWDRCGLSAHRCDRGRVAPDHRLA